MIASRHGFAMRGRQMTIAGPGSTFLLDDGHASLVPAKSFRYGPTRESAL